MASNSSRQMASLQEALKTKPFIVLNIDENRQVHLVASNRIEAGDLTDKFKLLDKKFQQRQDQAAGNHLILFDGSKQ